MRCRLLVPVLVALGCPVGLARPCAAQGHLEIGPLLGLYAPLGSFQPAPYYSTALPTGPGDMSALAVGAQARFWFRARLGLQLQAAVASSNVGGGNTPGGVTPPSTVHILTGTVQALYNLHPWGRTRLWISGGAGLIRHGGTAYAPYGSPSRAAGVLGLGTSLPLTKHLRGELGLSTLFYSFDLQDSTATSIEHGFQVDPVASLGFSWGWF